MAIFILNLSSFFGIWQPLLRSAFSTVTDRVKILFYYINKLEYLGPDLRCAGRMRNNERRHPPCRPKSLFSLCHLE